MNYVYNLESVTFKIQDNLDLEKDGIILGGKGTDNYQKVKK